jgi:hypothetical protein
MRRALQATLNSALLCSGAAADEPLIFALARRRFPHFEISEPDPSRRVRNPASYSTTLSTSWFMSQLALIGSRSGADPSLAGVAHP